MTTHVRITTLAQLVRLKSLAARRGIRSISVELPGSGPTATIEKRINARLRACGCEVGAAMVCSGAAVLGAAAMAGVRPGVGASIVVLFALGLLGKLLGLAAAELRMRAAIDAFISFGERDEVG